MFCYRWYDAVTTPKLLNNTSQNILFSIYHSNLWNIQKKKKKNLLSLKVLAATSSRAFTTLSFFLALCCFVLLSMIILECSVSSCPIGALADADAAAERHGYQRRRFGVTSPPGYRRRPASSTRAHFCWRRRTLKTRGLRMEETFK